MKQQEESTAGGGSSLAYLFGGFALGTVCGLLFAPKPGKELREDINEWGRHNRERGRELVARVKEYIPHKVKNAVNEAKGAGEQAYRGVKEKIDDAFQS